MSQQIVLQCNKKSSFSVAKDERFTSEKLGIFDVVINVFLMSPKKSSLNMVKKQTFLCRNTWMLNVTKERLINVAINGFLMSQKFLMLQRRSTLMSQKTENVNVAKINYFNVQPTKMIFTMSQIRNISKMFQKQVMKYVRNSEFSRLGVSYLTSKIYCKCNYCSYDFTVLNLVLSNEKGNW